MIILRFLTTFCAAGSRRKCSGSLRGKFGGIYTNLYKIWNIYLMNWPTCSFYIINILNWNPHCLLILRYWREYWVAENRRRDSSGLQKFLATSICNFKDPPRYQWSEYFLVILSFQIFKNKNVEHFFSKIFFCARAKKNQAPWNLGVVPFVSNPKNKL